MNPGAVSIMRFHFSVVTGSQLADQQAAARCRLLARTGHGPMSDLSPLSGEERKSNFGAVRSGVDPWLRKNVRARKARDPKQTWEPQSKGRVLRHALSGSALYAFSPFPTTPPGYHAQQHFDTI